MYKLQYAVIAVILTSGLYMAFGKTGIHPLIKISLMVTMIVSILYIFYFLFGIMAGHSSKVNQ